MVPTPKTKRNGTNTQPMIKQAPPKQAPLYVASQAYKGPMLLHDKIVFDLMLDPKKVYVNHCWACDVVPTSKGYKFSINLYNL